MTRFPQICLGVSTVALMLFPGHHTKAWTPQARDAQTMPPLQLAYSVVDDAYKTCSKELARYGVRVSGMVDSYSGKGGATVVLRGVNAGGYPVTAECNLTIPSRALDIRYL